MTKNKKNRTENVLLDESVMKSKKDFEYWISLSLDFNKKAKASKKRKRKG